MERASPPFSNRRDLSFGNNARYFSRFDKEIPPLSDDEYRGWLDQTLKEAVSSRTDEEALSVAFDVSSLSRGRIAAIVETLSESDFECNIHATFLYAPARFTEPPQPGEITICQPVSAFFAGFSLFPGRPPTAIVGLGYEVDRALGVVEYLESDDVIALRPNGVDTKFDRAVRNANETLMARPGQRLYIADYQVNDPFGLFVMTESIVDGLRDSRPTLVPMGPKILALVSLVVCAIHLPDAAVWRVSAGDAESPTEKVPQGSLTGLELLVRAR